MQETILAIAQHPIAPSCSLQGHGSALASAAFPVHQTHSVPCHSGRMKTTGKHLNSCPEEPLQRTHVNRHDGQADSHSRPNPWSKLQGCPELAPAYLFLQMQSHGSMTPCRSCKQHSNFSLSHCPTIYTPAATGAEGFSSLKQREGIWLTG